MQHTLDQLIFRHKFKEFVLTVHYIYLSCSKFGNILQVGRIYQFYFVVVKNGLRLKTDR